MLESPWQRVIKEICCYLKPNHGCWNTLNDFIEHCQRLKPWHVKDCYKNSITEIWVERLAYACVDIIVISLSKQKNVGWRNEPASFTCLTNGLHLKTADHQPIIICNFHDSSHHLSQLANPGCLKSQSKSQSQEKEKDFRIAVVDLGSHCRSKVNSSRRVWNKNISPQTYVEISSPWSKKLGRKIEECGFSWRKLHFLILFLLSFLLLSL